MPEAKIRRLNLASLHALSQYSHVTEVQRRRTIYITGQIALDSQSNLVGAGDFAAQARQIFRNLAAALAGAGFEDAVKLTLLLIDRSDIALRATA